MRLYGTITLSPEEIEGKNEEQILAFVKEELDYLLPDAEVTEGQPVGDGYQVTVDYTGPEWINPRTSNVCYDCGAEHSDEYWDKHDWTHRGCDTTITGACAQRCYGEYPENYDSDEEE